MVGSRASRFTWDSCISDVAETLHQQCCAPSVYRLCELRRWITCNPVTRPVLSGRLRHEIVRTLANIASSPALPALPECDDLECDRNRYWRMDPGQHSSGSAVETLRFD